MNFKPKKESELYELLEKGEYPFEVVEAENAVSKNGNDMIKLKVAIYTANSDSPRCYIFDYLMEAVAYKLRHFCDATGLLSKYEDGTLDAFDCVNQTGYAKVIIQKDKEGQYPDKNSIADYVSKIGNRTATQQTATVAANATDSNDDLPF